MLKYKMKKINLSQCMPALWIKQTVEKLMSDGISKMRTNKDSICEENCAFFHGHVLSQCKKKNIKFRKIKIENESDFLYKKKQEKASDKTRKFELRRI